VSEPTPLVAHRCLVWAGRADGNTYEISRALGSDGQQLAESERRIALTWTPVEARRLSTYLVGMGWHDVGMERIALAELAEGRRQLAAQADDEARSEIRFAAPGGLRCRAVAASRPTGV
jgi:hypothetical protein